MTEGEVLGRKYFIPGRVIDSILLTYRATQRSEISTILFAGHDTTSSSVSWALYNMCRHKSVQDNLRAEFAKRIHTEAPTFDQLNSLPYLDAVVRETLRLHSSAEATNRVAAADSVIPLSEPFIDSNGIRHKEIRYVSFPHHSPTLSTPR